MCYALLLFMGNAISGGGGGGSVGGNRKTTESTRSGVPDLKMTTTSTTADAVGELTRDVELLKAAMDEKDRAIEQLAGAVEDIRVSLISYNNINNAIVHRVSTRTHHPPRSDVVRPDSVAVVNARDANFKSPWFTIAYTAAYSLACTDVI